MSLTSKHSDPRKIVMAYYVHNKIARIHAMLPFLYPSVSIHKFMVKK